MSETWMCKFPNCKRLAQPNGYCIGHRDFASFTQAKPPSKPKQVADSRKEKEKEYKKLVKELLAKSDRCQIKAPGCRKKANGMHHIQKRTEQNLLDRKNLVRACNHCNTWVENNPEEAKKLGFWVSRFKKDHSIIVAEHDPEVKATIVK